MVLFPHFILLWELPKILILAVLQGSCSQERQRSLILSVIRTLTFFSMKLTHYQLISHSMVELTDYFIFVFHNPLHSNIICYLEIWIYQISPYCFFLFSSLILLENRILPSSHFLLSSQSFCLSIWGSWVYSLFPIPLFYLEYITEFFLYFYFLFHLFCPLLKDMGKALISLMPHLVFKEVVYTDDH